MEILQGTQEELIADNENQLSDRLFEKLVDEQDELDEEAIEALAEALRECDHSFRMRADMLTNRRQTLKKSKIHFKTLRKLLERRLDKLMTVFSGTHPSFYGEYLEIRGL